MSAQQVEGAIEIAALRQQALSAAGEVGIMADLLKAQSTALYGAILQTDNPATLTFYALRADDLARRVNDLLTTP